MSQFMLTKDVIDNTIENVSYQRFGATGTLCVITLKNGYTVTGVSSCIDPSIYNEEIGQQIAYNDAYDKLWSLLGYQVKQAWYESTQLSYIERVELELQDLDAKIQKLDAFLVKGKPSNISQEAWDLLQQQLDVMRTYAMILQERIVLANK